MSSTQPNKTHVERLNDIPIILPRLWEGIEEFEQAEKHADEREKRVIRQQIQLAKLLERCEGLDSSPATIGWLSLWSRLINLSDCARGALHRTCWFSLEIANRLLFETSLCLFAICRLEEGGQDQATKRKTSIVEHLTAYLVWCLHSDLGRYKRKATKENLRGVYDPLPARDLAESLGEELAAWESEHGEIEILSDQEAELDIERAEARLQERMDMVKAWLKDDRLKPWAEMYRELGSGSRPVSFLDLIGAGREHLLRSWNMRWASLAYVDGSALVHGSTLEFSVQQDPSCFVPHFGDLHEKLDSSLDWSITQLNSSRVWLTTAVEALD